MHKIWFAFFLYAQTIILLYQQTIGIVLLQNNDKTSRKVRDFIIFNMENREMNEKMCFFHFFLCKSKFQSGIIDIEIYF
jgi:hypothetical protein